VAHPSARLWAPAVALAIVALGFGGCGGRIAAIGDDEGDDAGDDGAVVGDGTTRDGGSDVNGGRGAAPLPVCTGVTRCFEDDGGLPSGGAEIQCDPAPFVGPWNLVLQRQVNGIFENVQKQSVQAPGFGAKFSEILGRTALLTYRVCVVDDIGTRCPDPFTLSATPGCACEPATCAYSNACNTTIFDGCSRYLNCGACTNGTTCNLTTRSCCPDGFMSDGAQGCVCAPPAPCPGRQVWDWQHCACDVIEP